MRMSLILYGGYGGLGAILQTDSLLLIINIFSTKVKF